jgi:hypothetical protein
MFLAAMACLMGCSHGSRTSELKTTEYTDEHGYKHINPSDSRYASTPQVAGSLAGAAAATVRVANEVPEKFAPSAPLWELGATIGTPAALNLVVGYWSTANFPWVARAMGMYFPTPKGIQLDAGWGFDHEGSLKQFLSLSFVASRLGDVNSLIGVGPMYGFNWGGFSIEGGAVAGSYKSTDGFGNYVVGLPIQLQLQLGYTSIF